MSIDLPARGPLTDALADHFAASLLLSERGILFGDASVPVAAGWAQNQPGQGAFTASVTLTTGDALPLANETIRSRHSTWRMVYGLKSIGGLRTQADHAADRARAAALAFPRGPITLGAFDWTVQAIVFAKLAPVRKVDPTDAPTFELDDVFEVWMARTMP